MSKQIVWVRGKRACSCWADILPGLEADLVAAGYIKRDLSGLITQGSYNTSVAASAGTHSGGGVWDVKHSLVNSDAKKRVWLKWGVVPFERTGADGNWSPHGHTAVAGCPHLAASAARQVTQARSGRNALVSNRPFRGLGGKPTIITYREALAREERERKAKRSWFDMASKKDLEEAITAALERRDWGKVLPDKEYKKSFPAVVNSSWRNNILHIQHELDTVRAQNDRIERKLDALLKGGK